MKKVSWLMTILLLVVLGHASTVLGAAGSCVQSDIITTCGNDPQGTPCLKSVNFNCTWGTAGDATTDLTATISIEDMAKIKGWYLIMGATYNGSTAPTDQYDIYLRETVGSTADAVDVLGTAGKDRPGTAGVSSQFKPLVSTSLLIPGIRPIVNTLKLTAGGNAVASGNAIVQFIFGK